MFTDGRTAQAAQIKRFCSFVSECKVELFGTGYTNEDFKQVYVDAWKGGAKGCTTFRISGKRFGIFNETVEAEKKVSSTNEEMVEEEGKVEACFIDPLTGQKECA